MTSEYYQFRIVLLGILPMIWRRIQVPADYSFWDLHVAIQDSMGWTDSHLHDFRIVNPKTHHQDVIGIPDDAGIDTEPGWELRIRDYFDIYSNPIAVYEYDFGDSWIHEVVLEDWGRRASSSLPICVSGERGCPPEDVGGARGYGEFLKAIGDPNHPEREEWLTWVGGSFEPEEFRAEGVHFDDPRHRWSRAFEHDQEDAEFPGPIDSTSILSDLQVNAIASLMRKEPILARAERRSGISVEDTIRFGPLSKRCIEAREKRGLTIKEVSKQLKIPQYRLKAVEMGSKRELLPAALKKYTSFLGLDSWLDEWSIANPELARDLRLMEREDGA